MFYTKNGDDGKTEVFGCDQRLSKSSAVAEALGVLDEINSYLGICKVKLLEKSFDVFGEKDVDIVEEIQDNLFTIQAQVAGADKKVSDGQLKKTEKIIEKIEGNIPKVKSFIVSGSCEMSAMFDFARTLARTAERRVVAVSEEALVKIDANSLKYLNRLSSFLFALARHSAYKSGINEGSPKYK